MKKLMFSVLCLLLSGSFVEAQTEPSASVYAVNTNVDNVATIAVQDDDQGGRTKFFSKTFASDQSDKVNLNNQFGSIVIKTWDRKEVKADIQITAYSNNDEDAQKLLDEVSIDAGKSGDLISFNTQIADRKNNWGSGSRNGRKWRREVRVNYVVYMPAANALNVSQQYGNVTMGDFSGPVTAKVQYGNFKAGNLSSSSNNLLVQYGNTDIMQINRATIKHQYGSGLTLGTVGSINLTAQYVKADIRAITGDAVIKQQYGEGLTLGTVNRLTLNAQYARVSIANLSGDGTFDLQYNNLNIQHVSESCKRLVVNAQYVNVSIDFSENYNASLDVQTSYAGFNHGNSVSANTTGDDDSTTKNYTGKIGRGSSNYVKVKSAYGSVTFK